MVIDEALIAGRKKRIADAIADAPGILEQVYARKDFRRVGHNVDVLDRSILLRGMMAQRLQRDADAALADFRLAAEWTREFDKALDAIRNSAPPLISADLDIAAFEIPLFACVLAGMRTRAREVASLTRDPLVRDLEDPIDALMTRFWAALILDDAADFQRLRARHERTKKTRWSQYVAIYVGMYEAVLHGDTARYHELAVQADSKFRARAKDRKLGTFRPEYGGLQENAVVLDFMALGIANVAQGRNVPLPQDTDIVPHVLVEAASRAAR